MKLYVCTTDWLHECKDVPHQVKFFKSVSRLKQHKKCWKECGIVELEVSLSKEVYSSRMNSKYLKHE